MILKCYSEWKPHWAGWKFCPITVGIEPTTSGMQVMRFTDWATWSGRFVIAIFHNWLQVFAQAKIVLKTIHDTLPQFDCFPSEMQHICSHFHVLLNILRKKRKYCLNSWLIN